MAQIRFIPDSTNPDSRNATGEASVNLKWEQQTSRKASKALKLAHEALEPQEVPKRVCLTCGGSDGCDCECSKD